MDVIVSDGVLKLYKFVFTEVNTSSCKCAIWSIEQILEAPATPLVILIGITYTSEVSDLEFVNPVIIIRFYRKTTRISKGQIYLYYVYVQHIWIGTIYLLLK